MAFSQFRSIQVALAQPDGAFKIWQCWNGHLEDSKNRNITTVKGID
jgi:hypothetical protein